MWKYDVVARHHGEAANVFGLINEQNTKWPSRCLDLILRSDGANRRLKLQKRRQLFIRTHDETLSVAAMRVSNEDHELVLCASLRICFFGHITPCACGVRGASAACDGFGFARKTAAPFDVFYWLQVTNFDVLSDSGTPSGADHFDVLFDSAPKGANHFDVWDFGIHAKMDLAGEFIAYPNIRNRRTTGYRTKVLSRQSRRANVYD
jgi:hypothetical protein